MKNLHQIFRYNQTSQTIKAILVIVLVYSGLLLMDYSTNHQHSGTICIFKLVTGYPCAGCGLGRATLALFKGNIIESFHYNILCLPITMGIIISLCWLILDLIKQKETFFETINRPVKTVFLIPFFVITAISWYMNIIRGI